MDTKDYSKRYENTLVAIVFFSWGTVFLDRISQLYLVPYISRLWQRSTSVQQICEP